MTTHVVVMGVAGCGKSSVARALADRLGWAFTEGDDLHPAANIAKMSAGIPLTDDDRWPWLRAIVAATSTEPPANTIVTCSALKRAYRDVLREAAGGTVFVHLVGTPEQIAQRLAARTGHFMPPGLLPSQFAALEPLAPDEDGLAVDITETPGQIADRVVAFLGLPPAHEGVNP